MNRTALRILYQDEHLVAVHKPGGLLVHPSPLDPRASASAMKLLRDQLGRWVYPVHRIDRPTSGVLLFALDSETARRLGAAFEQRQVGKRYLGVVRGWPEPAGLIDHPLREQLDRIADALADPDKAAQPAQTRFRRLATAELPISDGRHPSSRYALMELVPETGRKHQLRRHLKHLGHPVIGDTTWGKSLHNRLFQREFGSERLLLHCAGLEFSHPWDGGVVRVEDPLPDDFARVIAALGWEHAVS